MAREIFLSCGRAPEGAEDLGLVSAHCVMGTSFMAGLSSFFTDFMGKKSKAVNLAVQRAEEEAIRSLKEKAAAMGADSVHDVRMSASEASENHGMIIFSVYGGATRGGK